ncbi:hypothetical protein [Carnobacterium maltaromaticum]|uniref:hypothetical protein n=1 Tax=Carnobacterium maltaromaticum TaxID=2751 RepID=UPI0039BDDAC5
MDCRHTNRAELDAFTAEIEADMKRIAEEMGMEIEINIWMNDLQLQWTEFSDVLKEVSEAEGINLCNNTSGAGSNFTNYCTSPNTMILYQVIYSEVAEKRGLS